MRSSVSSLLVLALLAPAHAAQPDDGGRPGLDGPTASPVIRGIDDPALVDVPVSSDGAWRPVIAPDALPDTSADTLQLLLEGSHLGVHALARLTPVSEEVDEHGQLAAQDLLLELGFADDLGHSP